MGNQNLKVKTRCVIYDCDGVLFESMEANRRLYNDVCASIGRAPLTEEEVRYVHCHTVFEAIHFVFRDDGDMEKRALESLKQIDLRDYIGYLKMEPYLLQILNLLRAKGIIRALSTNR